MNNKKNTYFAAAALIFVGAFSRFLDFMPNFSPMESIALFGAAYLGHKVLAYAVPIIAMYVSDLVLNNTLTRAFFPDKEGIVLFDDYMIYNFIGMIAIVAVGRVLLKNVSAVKVGAGALIASSLFFVITNIGSWLSLPIYTKDLAGLTTAYSAGLPFFNNSWVSTLVFSTILFGSFEFYKKYTNAQITDNLTMSEVTTK